MLKFQTLRGAQATAACFGMMVVAGSQALGQTVLTNNDGIIRNSVCVGTDCANDESFGFDTIRLKENNLRIMFVDTSAGAFPSRDWQVVANSNASGGANYFGIRDCGNNNGGGASECGTRVFAVSGGAAGDSIFVASTGRIGFRTATPVLDLHVRTGNTPGLRLEQDGSSGFTPQTWDIAGNEANFFVRDVTGGSRLPFRIRPGAPTNSINVANTGFVGIGTASPVEPLHVVNSAPSLRLESTDPGSPAWSVLVSSGIFSFKDQVNNVSPFRVRPGAPFNSFEIRATGALTFGAYPNCAGLGTNAAGVVQCLAAGGGGAGASTPAGGPGAAVTLAAASSGGASSGGTATGSAATADKDGSGASNEPIGCSAGDLAGDWSLIGTSIQRFGDNSVLWCDLRLRTGQDALRYDVSGRCRSHEPNEAVNQQGAELTAKGTISENAACRFGGSLKIKKGSVLLTTATIIEGRIEGPGARKTRAVGVSRLIRGRTSALQTVVMQR